MNENRAVAAPSGVSESAPPDRFDGRYFVWAALIIALAAAVRLAFIARYDVWLDEAFCFLTARKSLAAIVHALREDNAPPLYFFLLHWWMQLFGESAAAMRSLSALFSTGAVAVILFWRTPWFGRTARLAAGFVLAITPLAIYYGQEARMYAAVVFFVTLSTVFLEKGLRAGGGRNWALFAVFTALGLYTSYVAIFLAPIGYVVVAVRLIRDADEALARRRLFGLVAAHAAAAALFSPWLPIFLKQPTAHAIQWITPFWMMSNKPLLPLQSFSVMTVGGSYYPRFIRQLGEDPERLASMREDVKAGRDTRLLPGILTTVPPMAPMVITLCLTTAAFLLALRRGGGAFPYRTLLVSWAALAPLVPFILSYLTPMYFTGRYEVTGVPAFAILFGIGLSRMARPFRAPAAILAGALFAYTWGYAQSFPSTGVYKERGALVGAADKHCVVVCESFEYATIYYYAGSRRDDLQFMTFPRDIIRHAGWIDYDKWLMPPDEWSVAREQLLSEGVSTVREAIRRAGPGGRVMLVRAPPEGLPYITAIDDAIIKAVAESAGAGQIEYDQPASRSDKGILLFRVRG